MTRRYYTPTRRRRALRRSNVNVGTFDRFSLLHAAFGVWAGARGFGLMPLIAMHTLWELFEARYQERVSADRFTFSPESRANRLGDFVACLVGWSLNLSDRLSADPWVGELNPLRLVSGEPSSHRIQQLEQEGR